MSRDVKSNHSVFPFLFISLQQFGKILDVEIIFNERGSKVHCPSVFVYVCVFTVDSCTIHTEMKLMLYAIFDIITLYLWYVFGPALAVSAFSALHPQNISGLFQYKI